MNKIKYGWKNSELNSYEESFKEKYPHFAEGNDPLKTLSWSKENSVWKRQKHRSKLRVLQKKKHWGCFKIWSLPLMAKGESEQGGKKWINYLPQKIYEDAECGV